MSKPSGPLLLAGLPSRVRGPARKAIWAAKPAGKTNGRGIGSAGKRRFPPDVAHSGMATEEGASDRQTGGESGPLQIFLRKQPE